MAAKTTTWVGGTVFAAVAVLAASWVFAISPQLAAADAAHAEQSSVEDHNAKLQSDLKKLKAQYENLGKYKGDIAALETQIPATAKLTDYLREVDSATSAAGAFVVSVKPGTPVSVTGAAAAAAAAAPPSAKPSATPSASPSAGAGGAAAAAAAAATPAGTAASSAASVDGFVAIPVDITLLGSAQKVTDALDRLQNSSSRLFLVTALSGKGTDAKPASEGRPATAKGDLELTISGYAYVLSGPPSDSPTPAPSGGSTAAPALPSGPGNGSPLSKA